MHGRNLRARGVASVDEYIGVLGTPHNDVAARLREIVLRRYPQLREDIKWHVPVYSLGMTPIVSIEGFKAHVNLKFFRGAVLRDRWNILEGTGKGVRHVKFRSTEDVDEGKIRELSGTTLTDIFGIGPILAAKIIGTVGNVARFPTKAHFASYSGTAPVEVSSGEVVRHRLSLEGVMNSSHF